MVIWFLRVLRPKGIDLVVTWDIILLVRSKEPKRPIVWALIIDLDLVTLHTSRSPGSPKVRALPPNLNRLLNLSLKLSQSPALNPTKENQLKVWIKPISKSRGWINFSLNYSCLNLNSIRAHLSLINKLENNMPQNNLCQEQDLSLLCCQITKKITWHKLKRREVRTFIILQLRILQDKYLKTRKFYPRWRNINRQRALKMPTRWEL